MSSLSVLGDGVGTTRPRASSCSGVSVATQGAALFAQGRLDAHLGEVNWVAGAVGVGLSRRSVAAANLQTNIEATKAAEESARLVAAGILQQAAAAVPAQATRELELVLKLLRP